MCLHVCPGFSVKTCSLCILCDCVCMSEVAVMILIADKYVIVLGVLWCMCMYVCMCESVSLYPCLFKS